MSKLIILCGLIGAGKTTYARSNYKWVSDLDYMPPFSRKQDQIRFTFWLLKTKGEACHITCFPTNEELVAFRKENKEFVLINTGLRQCEANILKRRRKRDFLDLSQIFLANRELIRRIKQAQIPWKVVNIFE